MSKKAEMICVGNELLIGKILNTNAQWLARRVTSLGMTVNRITVASDDICEIAKVVCEAIGRKPKFIITTGGLGPTFDDKTLEGIAKALDRRLEINNKALKMVKEKYENYAAVGKLEKIELTPPRVKMARLPARSKPLPNSVGTAPGVMISYKGTIMVALPGVPPEMEAIFEESVVPLLKKEAGKLAFFEKSIFVDSIMESSLAPLIDEAMHDNPYVYIKSHPKCREEEPRLEVHFSTTMENAKEAEERLEKTVRQLSRLILKSGGKIRR